MSHPAFYSLGFVGYLEKFKK